MSVSAGKAEQIIAELRKTITGVFSEIDTWLIKDARIRTFNPARDEWTIDRILEHVSLVNHYLLILIDKGARKAINRADEKKIEQELEHYEHSTPLMEEIGINDSFEWKCPRHMMPTGARLPEQVREVLAAGAATTWRNGLSRAPPRKSAAWQAAGRKPPANRAGGLRPARSRAVAPYCLIS